jgi:MerR family transcriptional regulator/heat shock protein HspR
MREHDSSEPVYVISVASELVGCHAQTLRMYERLGLLAPYRKNNVRLYSDEDIERIRRIQRLTQEMGVNLAGVEIILGLLDRIDSLQEQLDRQQEQLKQDLEEEFRRRLREALG